MPWALLAGRAAGAGARTSCLPCSERGARRSGWVGRGQREERMGCDPLRGAEDEAQLQPGPQVCGRPPRVGTRSRPCLMSRSEPFRRQGRSCRLTVRAAGDGLRDRQGEGQTPTRARASWRTRDLGRTSRKLSGTWAGAGRGWRGVSASSQLRPRCWGPSGKTRSQLCVRGGGDVRTCTHEVPFMASRMGRRPPGANGGSEAQNAEGGGGGVPSQAHLVRQRGLPSVGRLTPHGMPSDLDLARWAPDGTRVGGRQPGLDLALS